MLKILGASIQNLFAWATDWVPGICAALFLSETIQEGETFKEHKCDHGCS